MVYIILILIAIIFVAGLEPLARKLRIPFPLFLMLFGILFSTYGVYDFLGYLDEININVHEINILGEFSIQIAFLIAGIALSLTNLKNNKRGTLFLTAIPAILECLILGGITYIITNYITQIPGFSFVACLLVMGIFAMSSSVVTIPLILEKKTKKDILLDQIGFSSVGDNFFILPVLAIFFTITQMITTSNTINISVIIFTSITVILTLAGAAAIGYLYGLFISYIFNKIQKYESIKPFTIGLILIVGSLIIINITSILWGVLGLITAFFIGLTFDAKAQNPEIKIRTHKVIGQLYSNIFMPLIYLYIGSKLRIDLIINMYNVLIVIILIITALIVRTIIILIYLKIKGYDKKTIHLANVLFSAKGIMLLYFIPFLEPLFINNGLENLEIFIYILMTLSILITIPFSLIVGNILVSKKVQEEDNV